MEGIVCPTTVHRLAELYGNASRVRFRERIEWRLASIVDLPPNAFRQRS